jgi:hypothetical protein
MPPATSLSVEMAISRSTRVTKIFDVPPSGGTRPSLAMPRRTNSKCTAYSTKYIRVTNAASHSLGDRIRAGRMFQNSSRACRQATRGGAFLKSRTAFSSICGSGLSSLSKMTVYSPRA